MWLTYLLICYTAATHFNPESSFDMRDLSLLEPAAGIPVMRTLSDFSQHIQGFLGLATSFHLLDLNTLLDYWISNVRQVPPTWKNLLLIIRLLNLDDLAQWMETYLSGATEEQPCHSKEEKMATVKVEEGERFSDMSVFCFSSLSVYCYRGW